MSASSSPSSFWPCVTRSLPRAKEVPRWRRPWTSLSNLCRGPHRGRKTSQTSLPRASRLSKRRYIKKPNKTLSSRAYSSFSIPFKLLSLLCCLAETSDHLRAVMPRFANYLHYSIFECNRLYNLKGYQAKNVVRMYLCVLRATGRFSVFLYVRSVNF